MKKFITIIPILGVLFLTSANVIYGQNQAEESASLKSQNETGTYDYRVANLRAYLEKFNSPLAPYAQDFVNYADENGLDYRLVPAISGVESTFGKFIPDGSYNAYGWVKGDYYFKSWPDSISTVSATLKNAYIDKGAESIPEIAKIYAPPSTTWGGNVKFFVSKIDTLPLNFDI